jgi:hypothetical protein
MTNALNVDILSAYVGIITTATVSIYAGSFGSLPVSSHLRQPGIAIQLVELARYDA